MYHLTVIGNIRAVAGPAGEAPIRPPEPVPRREPPAARVIDYWRQVDLVTPADLTFGVNLIGAGGLGSPIALALAKMGCPRLAIFDPDVVEPHNLPNQLFRLADVDRPKVEALAEILREFADVAVDAVRESVDERRFDGVVISAVDTMAARRSIWERSVRFRAGVTLYIDARLGGEVGRVLTTLPTNPLAIERYETSLFSDDDASIEPCTAQATMYTTLGIASLVANQVKRYARGESLIADQVIDFSTSTLLADGPTL